MLLENRRTPSIQDGCVRIVPKELRTENLDAPRGCVVISTPMENSSHGVLHWAVFATCQGSAWVRTLWCCHHRSGHAGRLGMETSPGFRRRYPVGTTPPAERLLTALPGTPLPSRVGAFAPKIASLPSCSRKRVANCLLAGRSPTTALQQHAPILAVRPTKVDRLGLPLVGLPRLARMPFFHAGDKPAHRMLIPAAAVAPSFVMSSNSSLTSLGAVTPQAAIQRLPLPEEELFPRAASAQDFALRAYKLGLPIGLSRSQFGCVFDEFDLEGLSPLSRLSYSPPETYSGRRASHGPVRRVATHEAPRPSCVERPLLAQTVWTSRKRTPQAGLRRETRPHLLWNHDGLVC